MIYTCYKTESLAEVLKRLVETKVYRLICVDSTNRVEGIISLSDILHFFIV
jgi:predicted transcriptional regulator